MVKINCMGGGGYFSDDVSATKAQVVKGHTTITKDQNDEIIEGTMAEVPANDSSNQLYMSGQNLYIGMTNGAHRTINSTLNLEYPEVSVQLSNLSNTIGATDPSKILSGTTISGKAGTMTNNGSWSSSLGLSGQVTIPKGYHDGTGKITRAYSTFAGQVITPSSQDQTLQTKNKIITSNIVCLGNSKLTAANIKHGVSLFGITGTCPSSRYAAYDGSTFKGALNKGLISGIDYYCRLYDGPYLGDREIVRSIYNKWHGGTTYNTESINAPGYNLKNQTVTSGELYLEGYTRVDSADSSWFHYIGYRSVDTVNLGLYKSVIITYESSSSVYTYIHSVSLCVTNQDGTVTNTLSSDSNGVFDVSGITGRWYLGFIFRIVFESTKNSYDKFWTGRITKIEFV